MSQIKPYLWKISIVVTLIFISLLAVIPLFAASQANNNHLLLTATPSPASTLTSTPTGNLPDLVAQSATVHWANPCQPGDESYMTVTVQNQGAADADAFTVDLNGTVQTVDHLAIGETVNVIYPGAIGGTFVIIFVDRANVIAEQNESNNTLATIFPIPTPPPPCETATPTATPTVTPTAPTLPTAEAEIELSTETANVGEIFTLRSFGNLGLGHHTVYARVGTETAIIGKWQNGQLTVGPDVSIVEVLSADGPSSGFEATFILQANEAGTVELRTTINGEVCNEMSCYFTTAASQIIELTVLESCGYDSWDATKVYWGGDKVAHNGHQWRAKWWTQNEEPGTTGQYGVWEDLGPCPGTTPTVTPTSSPTATPPTITPTPSPTATTPPGTEVWAPNVAYNVGDIVLYSGQLYRCQIAHTSLLGWEPNVVPALWTPQS